MLPIPGTVRPTRGAIALAALSVALSFAPVARAEGNVTRIAGPDRYDTMQRIAQEGFDYSEWAVIATGENFPDALAASSLAGVHSCPILLTQTDRLSAETRDELNRLGVRHALLAGGPKAISKAVANEIADLGISVERFSGKDRAETSVEVFHATRASGALSDTVVVAAGETFADSLSIGPWSWVSQTPIILARNGDLGGEAIAAIKADEHVKRIIIVGGRAVVSDSVSKDLGDDYTYLRLSGPDRYHTSAIVAEWEATNGLSWAKPAIATGTNFPDALAGAPLQGVLQSPIMLVSDSNLTGFGVAVAHHDAIGGMGILGGTKSVSSYADTTLAWILNVGV